MVKVQARKPVAVAPTDATSIWTSQNPVFRKLWFTSGQPFSGKAVRALDAPLPPEPLHPMPVEEADLEAAGGQQGNPQSSTGATNNYVSSNLFTN